MTRYDYGLIPYRPNPSNRRHLDSALPSKLFDYLASGLSVLSENLESLREFLTGHEAGVVYDRVDDIPALLKDLECLQPADSVQFTMEKAIPELERLYSLVLEGIPERRHCIEPLYWYRRCGETPLIESVLRARITRSVFRWIPWDLE